MAFIGALTALITGCSSVGYYRQAAAGQYQILARQEPIRKMLAQPDTRPSLRAKLELVLELREFAEGELHLKTDGHYSRYADLGRRHVVWNVYAAPEFSLEPRKWWYPIVGSLKYRGFFSEQDARDYGARLAQEGYDVYVGGVDAYSTLGWFKDPVLNTFIHHDRTELAEILFHELAHQRVFAKGDTDFNEAFATAVGEEGVRRWLAAQGETNGLAAYEAELRKKDQFVALVMRARERLKAVYGETEPSDGSSPKHRQRSRTDDTNESLRHTQRAAKAEVIAQFRADYEQLKASWGGDPSYDNWFKRPINNARLNTIATYYHFVPAFQRLLAKHRGDLVGFYDEARALSALDKDTRHARMAALAQRTAPAVAAR